MAARAFASNWLSSRLAGVKLIASRRDGSAGLAAGLLELAGPGEDQLDDERVELDRAVRVDRRLDDRA